MTSCQSRYRGRFAPSPTGPLHFGSLVGALASYLDARCAEGIWLVRIEDIDPLREIPAASGSILKSLEAHGLYWDEQVLYQSQHSTRYQDLLDAELQKGTVYRCPCSRRELRAAAHKHRSDCREKQVAITQPHALRFAVTRKKIHFNDLIQGPRCYALSRRDDFIVRRRDGFFAYQLAVVADDHEQNITHVIRGIDLIDSTPWQIELYQSLGWQPPAFGHFPVVIDCLGNKLSKQRLAPKLDDKYPLMNLRNAALALSLISPTDPLPDKLEGVLDLLLSKWSRKRYQSISEISEPLEAKTPFLKPRPQALR